MSSGDDGNDDDDDEEEDDDDDDSCDMVATSTPSNKHTAPLLVQSLNVILIVI